MAEKKPTPMSADSIHKAQIGELVKSQDGILGIPMVSLPGTTSFMFAGWYIRGIPLLICGSNQVITLPSVFDAESTNLVCELYGSEREVSKYTVDLNLRVQVTTSQAISLKELHPDAAREALVCEGGAVGTLDVIGDIERELKKIGAFIEQVVRECNADPKCVFDKVWAHLVRQICGGDCFRDCTYDCKPWDLACHARKLDCERLKAQCKICEKALEIGKEFVKGWLCINYSVCIP